jgi:serine protease Do
MKPRIHNKLILLTYLLAFTPTVLAGNNDGTEILRSIGSTFAKIAANASPSVVSIQQEMEKDSSTQTNLNWAGFIVSSDGYILTNNYLTKVGQNFKVKLADDRTFDVKIIGSDKDTNIAVLKIDANDLPFLSLGDSDKIEPGEWVIGIGSPFGLSNTFSYGMVTAKHRAGFGIAAYEDFLQTNIIQNPGDGGGPLLNLDGQVIGINTFTVGEFSHPAIGFAIPINLAKTVYQQLVENGVVVRGFIGAAIQDMSPELARDLGIKETKGILVTGVSKGSPADKAGLQKGDIIESAGVPVLKAKSFQYLVSMLKPGTKIDLVVLRKNERVPIIVEIGKRPQP